MGGYTLTQEQIKLVQTIEDRWDDQYLFVVWMMRSGKTLPICEWVSRQSYSTSVLVVCPPAVVPVWEKHYLAQQTGLSPRMEILSSGKLSAKKNGKAVVRSEMKNDWDVVIVDEIHEYRYYSARYQNLRWLSKNSEYRIGLTGTPIDQHLSELYYPLTWLSNGLFFGEYITKEAFQLTYCHQTKPRLKEASPWEIRPDIREEFLAEVMKVTSVWENPSVKPPEHKKVEYPLTKIQRKRISELRKGRYRVFARKWQSDLTGLKLAHRKDKMRQIYGGFLLDELGEVSPYRTVSWKWLWLARLLRKTSNRTVVWYRYRTEIELISEVAQDVGLSSAEFSLKQLDAFNEDRLDVLICHPKSAGAGIDISHADSAIFVTPTPNWTALMQAFYRLADRTEKRKVIYHMVAAIKEDRESYEALWAKEQVTTEFYNA